MQMLNLGLSIMNKVQTMQHRQVRIAQQLRKQQNQPLTNEKQDISSMIMDAEILDFSKPHKI
jgi:predicted transposase YdaD